MTMKALFIAEPGKTELREVPLPRPAADELLLRVRRVGYCGSDLNTFRGRNPMVTLPRIPGHEVAATIERAIDGLAANSDKPQLPDVVSPPVE